MIIPTERSFIGEKLVAQDSRTFTVQGYYGAHLMKDGIPWDFLWGTKTKTFSKNRKWNKKLRYILNKGSAVNVGADMTLRGSK